MAARAVRVLLAAPMLCWSFASSELQASFIQSDPGGRGDLSVQIWVEQTSPDLSFGYWLSQPAYVAVFEIAPGLGTGLVYPGHGLGPGAFAEGAFAGTGEHPEVRVFQQDFIRRGIRGLRDRRGLRRYGGSFGSYLSLGATGGGLTGTGYLFIVAARDPLDLSRFQSARTVGLVSYSEGDRYRTSTLGDVRTTMEALIYDLVGGRPASEWSVSYTAFSLDVLDRGSRFGPYSSFLDCRFGYSAFLGGYPFGGATGILSIPISVSDGLFGFDAFGGIPGLVGRSGCGRFLFFGREAQAGGAGPAGGGGGTSEVSSLPVNIYPRLPAERGAPLKRDFGSPGATALPQIPKGGLPSHIERTTRGPTLESPAPSAEGARAGEEAPPQALPSPPTVHRVAAPTVRRASPRPAVRRAPPRPTVRRASPRPAVRRAPPRPAVRRAPPRPAVRRA
ncbi:MAG: hypothetical protein ACE5HQ_12855, partial [Gemmatimonadota bacterium]